MSDRPRVLITNADERSMLAVCRSLHAGGYAVTAASSTRLASAQWSRCCSRRLRVVDPRRSSTQFVEQLRDELKSRSYRALIAGSDSALLAISEQRERLQTLTELGLPDRSVLERAMSRECLAQAADQAGLPVAASLRCENVEQAVTAGERLGFPVAIKSTQAARGAEHAVHSVPKGRVVSTTAELAEAAAGFVGDMLVQRWVRGDVVSLGGVFAGGRLLGAATSRYRRMWPPTSGSVTFSETIAPPPGLLDAVRRLMLVVGWEGIFELELIQASPNELVPIDLNPRPYGSLALAQAAGVPLAALWCDWLTRRSPEQAAGSGTVLARPGMRYRWEDGDFRNALWQLRHGHLGAALRPLRPYSKVTHAHFRLTDPLPLLARTLHLGQRLISER